MSRRNKVFLALIAVVLGIQLIRPARTNPPVDPQRELAAHSQLPPQVANALNRSCNDCHSYRTTWPWYSQIAPFSWVITDDVNQGRRHVNLSDWAQYDPKRADHKLDQICEEVRGNWMPLTSYKLMHPASRLTEHERGEICVWVGAERERLAKAASNVETQDVRTPGAELNAARCNPKLLRKDSLPKNVEFARREHETPSGFLPLISFNVLESGEVTNPTVQRSSGLSSIDNYALNWIRNTRYNSRPGCGVVKSAAAVTIDWR